MIYIIKTSKKLYIYIYLGLGPLEDAGSHLETGHCFGSLMDEPIKKIKIKMSLGIYLIKKT